MTEQPRRGKFPDELDESAERTAPKLLSALRFAREEITAKANEVTVGWRSRRDQRQAIKMLSPHRSRNARRYMRAHGIPDLPGIWLSPRRFYGLAQESVTEHDDGWSVTTADPGHKFIAWETAVRYEAASSEAKLHYSQLCDGPIEEEYHERVERITSCLAQMSRLSEIELASKPMFLEEPEVIRALVRCPRPRFEDPPPEPRLEELANQHLADIVPTLSEVIALQKQQAPFQPEVLALLLRAEEMIPGAGMHHSVLLGHRSYVYPFNSEYEAVLRPLRYALCELGHAYLQATSARNAVHTAGGHLEGCMKIVCGNRYRNKPLGALLQCTEAKKRLDASALGAMTEFTQVGVNPAKHEYANERGPIPLFHFDDALYAHFLARRFGASALEAVGKLQRAVDAAEQAVEQQVYFRGAALPVA